MARHRRKNITYNTHALPGSEQSGDTDYEPNCRKDPPSTTSSTQGDDECDDDTKHNTTNTKTPSEENTRPIAITNGISNEHGMRLVTKIPFDSADNISESRRMGGVCQSMKESCPFLGRK